jgi:hypothetical protein
VVITKSSISYTMHRTRCTRPAETSYKFPGPRSFLRATKDEDTEQDDQTRLWITCLAQASPRYLYHSARTTYKVLAEILETAIVIRFHFVPYLPCDHIS